MSTARVCVTPEKTSSSIALPCSTETKRVFGRHTTPARHVPLSVPAAVAVSSRASVGSGDASVTSWPRPASSWASPAPSTWPITSTTSTRGPIVSSRNIAVTWSTTAGESRPVTAPRGRAADVRPGLPSGRHDDGVGLQRQHRLGIGGRAEPDVDTTPTALIGPPCCELPHLLASREPAGEADHAAQLGVALQEDDVVAAGSGHPGRFQPGRSPADDDDPPGSRSRNERAGSELGISAHRRVLGALDRQRPVEVPVAELVAAGAAPDLAVAAALGLGDPLRVGDQRPDQRDRVRLTPLEDAFGFRRRDDAVHREHGRVRAPHPSRSSRRRRRADAGGTSAARGRRGCRRSR